jgi:hypothetical protein
MNPDRSSGMARFNGASPRSATWDEMRRMIREEAPERPSTPLRRETQ